MAKPKPQGNGAPRNPIAGSLRLTPSQAEGDRETVEEALENQARKQAEENHE